VNFSHQKQQSTATNTAKLLKYCTKPLNERSQDDLTAGVRLLHGGAQLHTSAQTAACLQRRKWEVLQYPPHNPDLVPSDFYLLRPFKNFLSRKRFDDQNALQKTVVQYFTSLGKEHYCEGMFKLVKHWDKY
jgi:hypothetical protein